MKENAAPIVGHLTEVVLELKSTVLQAVPQVITGMVLLAAGVFIAFLLKWIGSAVVRWAFKVLPDSISENSLLKGNAQPLSVAVGRLIWLVVLFLVFTAVLKHWGLDILSSWLQNLAKYLPNILVGSIILFLGWKLKEYLAAALNKTLTRVEFAQAYLVSQTLSWSAFLISGLVALEQVGVDIGLIITVASVLAGVAGGGVALMFALGSKATVSDVLSCYQIRRHLKVGQRAKVAGYDGVVESIGPTCVVLDTEKGIATVPGRVFREEITLVLKD